MLNPFLLFVLGFFILWVSGEKNSTQMYYVRLKVDESALANVSESALDRYHSFNSYTLNNLTKTTECKWSKPDTKTCRCVDRYQWSTAACQSNPKCCGTENCGDNKFPCIPDTSVSFTGSLTLEDPQYHNCLADENSDKFKLCHNNLTTTIKRFYSQIYGFDSITITEYRIGSVVANFVVDVASDVDPSVLQGVSKDLATHLNALLHLETTGVVRLEVEKALVEFGADTTVSCSSDKDLGGRPDWNLRNHQNQTKDIHNGSQCTIVSSARTSSLRLSSASQLWKGRYSCSFVQRISSLRIEHRASAELDVCVLPKVVVSSSEPGFPRCQTSNAELQAVTVSCEVERTYEDYSLTWTTSNIDVALEPQEPVHNLGVTVFSAKTFVTCDSPNPKVSCNLTNRCLQEKQGHMDILVIRVGEVFCKAEGDWGDTKVGQKAVVKCRGSVGNRIRPCNDGGQWGSETSFCVNPVLHSVLSDAENSAIGQGKLETNAETVFNQLQSVTNNTRAINSVANLETSVNVIDTMGDKLSTLDNETTVDEFLGSSSNLLDKSLQSSWTSGSGNSGSQSLAEKYLSSVEALIGKANIKRQTRKPTKPNLDVAICNTTQMSCLNRVFNNNVTMRSENGVLIKTTGFLELERYLPKNNSDEDEPNSIVVSTTKNGTGPVRIQIAFQLVRPRPRNTELKCVYWDMNEHRWSGRGCKLVFSQSVNKEVCECDHLSAFAILMSKKPLKVPYLSEVTYAGLSVSILCLIVFLVVELLIWRDVVKTDTLHLRHCAHVNISVCLLVGDVCFLASHLSDDLSDMWCKTFVVLEHFCFLAMFFWMLCLSCILLHKTVYLSLHGISKTAYLRFSIVLGYVCPLLIVVITFLANGGEEGRYYSEESRWLTYNGTFKGSIFAFVLPVGIIVFVNVFFMCLVIIRLLQPVQVSQLKDKEKNSAKTVIRTVVLLTPVFGLTWGFGFVVLLVDLTQGTPAYAVHYVFTIMNAFQGLYVFLTTCLGDRMVREALQRYFHKKISDVSTVASSSNSSDKKSSVKKN